MCLQFSLIACCVHRLEPTNERESDWYLVSSEQDAMQVQLVTNRLLGQRFVLLVAAIFRLSSGH